MVKERRGAATVWAKVQAVFSTLTPPAARAAGVHFGQARIPILKKTESASAVLQSQQKKKKIFPMFYEFTHTHHPHHGSCRDVTAARKAKASLNLEKTRSCLQRVWACALLNPPL